MDLAQRQCGKNAAVISLRKCELYLLTATMEIDRLRLIEDYSLTSEELQILNQCEGAIDQARETIGNLHQEKKKDCQPAPRNGLLN